MWIRLWLTHILCGKHKNIGIFFKKMFDEVFHVVYIKSEYDYKMYSTYNH